MIQNRALKKRSCDACRRKKIRCDGPEFPGKPCTNCRDYSVECKYEEPALKKKRGPSKSYVQSLEARLERAESLLHLLVPDGNFTRALGIEVDPDTWIVHNADALAPSSMVSNSADLPLNDEKTQRDFVSRVLRAFNADIEVPDDDEHLMSTGITQLSDDLKNMHIDLEEYGFFGKSSGVTLVQTTLNLKTQHTSETKVSSRNSNPSSMGQHPSPYLRHLRKEFWSRNPFVRDLDVISHSPLQYQFPEPDLMASLIDLYFGKMNIIWPLLHRRVRPTLEAQWKYGLHTKDPKFAVTLLLVAAVGARFSDDSRVFIGDDQSQSAGWKYFNQVSVVQRSLIQPHGLYTLQFCALATIFLLSSSAPQSGWVLAGVGIRMAQDIGAHRRRKKVSSTPTAEDELMKRVFWVLVSLDRTLSSAIGRPTAIQEEDFDIDYLVECDDEFWDHPDPAQAWKQPEGKPSEIAAFNSMLRLNRVLAQVHRIIYSINKQKAALNLIHEEWEEWAVTEFDSLLNSWVDTIPSHLKWDPHNENLTWLQQSAWLHTSYYNLQILVHRPFLSSSKAPKNLVWTSLAICTNAARSTARILDCIVRRVITPFPHLSIHAFTSAIVLLLAIWGGKKAGPTTDPKIEINNVLMCMTYLKGQESRWHTAGKIWDILNELTSVGDISLTKKTPVRQEEANFHYPVSSNDAADVYTHDPSFGRTASASSYATVSPITSFSGSAANFPINSTGNSVSVPPELPPLPMYSTELGQLPFDPTGFFMQSRSRTSFVPQQQQYAQYAHARPAMLHHEGSALAYGEAADEIQDEFQYDPQNGVAQMDSFTTPFEQLAAAASNSQSFPSVDPILDNTVNLFANVPVRFDQIEDWRPYYTSYGDYPNANGHPGAGSSGENMF